MPSPLGLAMATGATLLAGLLTVPVPAQADPVQSGVTSSDAPYSTIQLQARSNLLVNDNGYNLPPGSSFNSITPALSDDGDVAFRVQIVYDVKSGTSTPGLWYGGDGQGDIVHRAGQDDSIDNDASIDADGDVAFTIAPGGGLNNQLWIYDGDGTPQQRFSLPLVPSSYTNPTLSDTGTVAARATFGSGTGWITTDAAGVGTLVAAENPVNGDPYYYLYTPDGNSAGQVAGKVGTNPDDFAPVEIRRFEADGTSTRVLANNAEDPASPYSRFDNSLSLNDEGEVAVVATRAADNVRVLLRTDGTTTTEVVEAGPTGTIRSFDSFPPDMNDAGQIVFRGNDENGSAVYVADADGSLTKVVGKGSQVATDLGEGQVGQHDTSPVFGGRPSINEAGDVAFAAALHPIGDNQVEWGSGVFVAYAGDDAPLMGTVHGSVTTTGGQPAEGAEVTFTGADTTVTATAGSDGTYDVDLVEGEYEATTALEGYREATQSVSVTAGEVAELTTELSPAALTLTPSRLDFQPALWRVGAGSVTLTNPSAVAQDWAIESSRPWLSVSDSDGTLAAGETVTIPVEADRASRASGTYRARLTVSTPDTDAVLPVTMTVRRADVAIDVAGKSRKVGGVAWLADRKLGTGDYGRTGASSTSATGHAIAGTKADAIFKQRRVGGKLVYVVRDLAAGTYRVQLGFAEFTKVARGKRVVNVLVDGRKQLKRYDVGARTKKPFRAAWASTQVKHSAGAMKIVVDGVRGKAILNALRVTELD
jgi:hypothetical protein